MSLLLALTSGAAPAVDLLCPVLDDGRRKRRRSDQEWCPGFLQVAAVADLLAPVTQDAPRRKRRADAWQAFLAPDVDLFAGMLDDGAAAARHWGDEFTAALPPDADVFGAVLDDGFVRRRPADTLHAYLPPDVEAPSPPPAPVTAATSGHARKTTRAYDRSQQIKRQNEAILAVVIAAVTSGALE